MCLSTKSILSRHGLLQSPSKVKDAISTLIGLAKSKKDDLHHIPLLGLTLDVLHHLKHVADDTKCLTEATKVRGHP